MVAIPEGFHDTKPLTGNLAVAVRLADAGLFVFPCDPSPRRDNPGKISKAPLTEHGFHDSSDDPLTVIEWWTKWPKALVGIDMGKSELVAIDLDRHDPEKDGVAAFDEIARKHDIRVGPVTSTQSGGFHLIFRQLESDPIGSSQNKIAPGIDHRGVGGYIIGPGSIMPDDSQWAGTGWISDDRFMDLVESFERGEIPTIPDALIDLIRGPKRDERNDTRPLSERAAPRAPLPRDDGEEEWAFVSKALAHIPSEDRTVWRDVGFALHDSGHSWARAVWDAWSRICASKFNAADQDTAWKSFSRNYSGKKVSMGSVIHTARQNGFTDRKHGGERISYSDEEMERLIENTRRRHGGCPEEC